MSHQWFTIITLLLGIIWTGILTYVFGIIIVRPLQRLEAAATEASRGNLSQEIVIPKTDDEIRSLSIAVDTMFKNIKNMVNDIERNFNETNKTVAEMRELVSETTSHSQTISDATSDIAKGAVSSADAVQETAEAVERATNIAKEVQQKAEQSNERSVEMLDTLSESTEVVHQLVRGIQSLADEQRG